MEINRINMTLNLHGGLLFVSTDGLRVENEGGDFQLLSWDEVRKATLTYGKAEE